MNSEEFERMRQHIENLRTGKIAVWFIDGKSVYHTYEDCRSLVGNCTRLEKTELRDAESMGLRLCRNCKVRTN